ncbi:MAG TPA: 2-C-methyl-D-erythritol 4-phosphate cytidylyltransferase, partial [Alphaproteobacteria bacterium]
MFETVALIVAAGRGQRLGGAVPKQYLTLAGEPLLRRSVRAFAGHPAVEAVRVVIHPADRAIYDQAVADLA